MTFLLIFALILFAVYSYISIKNLREKNKYLEKEFNKLLIQFTLLTTPKAKDDFSIRSNYQVVKEEVVTFSEAERTEIAEEITEVISNIQQKEEIIPKPEVQATPVLQEEYTSKPDEVRDNVRIKSPVQKSRSIQEFENLIGGRILNRIGAAALIIGISFFLKYAFDNNWISETMRIVIGFVIGSGLIAIGERYIKKDYRIFSQGLFGAGLATFYLTVYSAYNFYHIFSQPVAFVVMTLVSAISYFIAIRHNSQSISWIASLGAYITPILIRSDETNVLALTTFLTILNINQIFQIKYHPEWQKLIYHSFVMSYFYFFSLVDGFNTDQLNYIYGIIFLLFNFTIFYIYELQYKNLINTAIGVVNLFAVNLSIILILLERIDAKSTSLILLYLFLIIIINISQITFLRKKFNWKVNYIFSFSLSWLQGVLILSQTFVFLGNDEYISHYDLFVPIILWLFYYFAEFYLSKNFNEESKKYSIWLSILNAAFLYSGINLTMTGELLDWKPLIIAVFCIIYFIPTITSKFKPYMSEENIRVYLITSFILLLSATLIQFDAYLVPLLWLAEIIIISYYLYKTNNLLTLTYFKFTIAIPITYSLYYLFVNGLNDFSNITTAFINYRFPVFFISTISCYLLVRIPLPTFDKNFAIKEYIKDMTNIFESLFIILFTITFFNEFYEINCDLNKIYTESRLWTDSLFDYIRGIYYLIIAFILFYPTFIKNESIKISSIITLSTVSSIYMIFNYFVDTQLFRPYLNFRVAFFIISLAVIIKMIHLSKRDFPLRLSKYFRILLSILTFCFVTAEIDKYFGYNQTYSRMLENQQALANSIAWIFLSVIYLIIGIWRRIRIYRFIAIFLFGVSILKVFIFDLSYLETLYRIISFISLGVILITISFLYQKFKDIILMQESD